MGEIARKSALADVQVLSSGRKNIPILMEFGQRDLQNLLPAAKLLWIRFADPKASVRGRRWSFSSSLLPVRA